MTLFLVIGIPTGGAVAFVVAMGLYFLRNPEQIDKWSLLLNRFIFWNKEKRERRLISSSLDYRITNAAKNINKESEGVLPFGIRIKWRKPEEVTAYVQKKQVVVVLRKHDNLDKNIVEACMAYIPMALLPRSRNVIDQTILDSIDHYVVQRILCSGRYDSAYNYFVKNILDERRTDSSDFDIYYDSIGKVDSVGMFTRVLLEEYKKLGEQLYGTLEEQDYREETRLFLDFLHRFSTRERGDDTTPLFYSGQRIRVGIVLFAKQETLTKYGIQAHLHRIRVDYEQGANRIFLFSYARRTEQPVYDQDGFVVAVRRKADFNSLNQIEKQCRKLDFLRLLRKERFHTRSVHGMRHTAKYYAYDCLR